MSTPELNTLRQKLASRGVQGIIGLSRAVRRASRSGSKALNRADFAVFCDEMDLGIDAALRERVFVQLDQEPTDGTVDLEELLFGISPPLNEEQKGLVLAAFRKLDVDNDGSVTMADITRIYDAKNHPKVKTGELTEEKVLSEFMQVLEGTSGNRDGKIDLPEFERYYQHVASNFTMERKPQEYFCSMMRSCWRL